MWCVLCISLQGKVDLLRAAALVCVCTLLCVMPVAGVCILMFGAFPPSRRQQKDVALVNMANILHRAHFSADAAILAHAALDLTSDLFTSHYTLGNIYAVSRKHCSSDLWRWMTEKKPGLTLSCGGVL